MIQSIEFYAWRARVRFFDGGTVDVNYDCWKYRATDAEARRVAAHMALQARAAKSPEAQLFADLERQMKAVSDLCYQLYDKVRQGDSAVWEYWRWLMLDPQAPAHQRVPDADDTLNMRGSVPQQIGKLTARLHRLAVLAASDAFERITFLSIVAGVMPDAEADHYRGWPRGTGPVKVTDVTVYYPPGVEPPDLPPERPDQRRRRQRASRRAAGPPVKPVVKSVAPKALPSPRKPALATVPADAPKLLVAAKGKPAARPR